ncbi:hypothetical protein LEMA_P119640.1 [Plenodomus lingam JN3]|uniref:Uncharacterized protein n=1 Tax=Leptosphaeria maculans (strain JN3 / isolate v23.1.3 / race Av1-4-5-6-7-8) TaxID=985895 RepID=E4ZT42_LEPMJ|nr:hypothetical protein LEMA_P119640.1 [Plenodomus lingam JN3]CBX94473.1 hypothetical protein LEMA_P119640.1 [Plenodomus lingam JN3]
MMWDHGPGASRFILANRFADVTTCCTEVDTTMSLSKVSRWNQFRRQVPGSTSKATSHAALPKSDSCQNTMASVRSWPEEARGVKEHTWLSYVYGIGDVLLILLPIYFILLGFAAVSLNGKPTKDNTFGPKVEFAMDLGPTIFPIVFAAISGRSMKMIARYLAEKGAKLSTLELLMASQSVWGTFESQLLMQRLTIVGANLLFLWSLSPLGGQASLRLMQRGQQASSTPMRLRYLTTGPAGAMSSLATGSTQRGKYAEAGALYNAALLAPQAVKLGPQDPWGNVKIPSLAALNTSSADPNGWLDIPSRFSIPEQYASLVGVPIAGIPLDSENNFTIEYNYLSVDCKGFEQQPYPGLHGTGDPTATNYTKLDEMLPGQIWYNKSLYHLQPFDLLGGRASFFIDTTQDLARIPIGSAKGINQDVYLGRLDGFIGHYNQSRLNASEIETPREVLFASVYGISKDGLDQGLNIARCLLFQNHVEASIHCTGSQCATKKLRKSITDKRPKALTAFEHISIFDDFAREFPTAIKFSEGSSPTERFIANTSTFPFVQKAGRLYANEAYTNLSTVPPEVFSRRLSLVLNTYFQLSTQSSGYFGGLNNNLTVYGPDTLPATDVNVYLPANLSATNHTFFEWVGKYQRTVIDSNSPFLGATTTASTTVTREIFVCNFAWLALLLTSSFAIFVTGSVAILLKRKTLGPEMFGFVASLTYENPWAKIPKGGTMLDAMERARLLKDVEFHVGDVRGEDSIGHIAFAAGVPLRKLERGRLYC